MTEWFRDGRADNTVSTDDRAVQYGDGLFETIAIRDGAPRLWTYHVERLQTGAARLGLAVPAEDKLLDSLQAALGQAQADRNRCVAKILFTAGQGPRGYRRAGGAPTTLLTGIADAQRLPDSCYRDGVDLRLCHTRLAVQPLLAGMKTLNRLEQVIARNEWNDDSVFEGLTLDTDGRLICGTMSNVFIVTGQALVTPAISRCGVSGVMRRHVLALSDGAGIECRVRDVEAEELWAADAVFISNSQFGVLPARRCGAHTWQPNETFRRIASLLRDSGAVEGPA
ncbi:MAG TPA: aminodeoxychorismate lyase [Woeseiaceae bacterium]|nr:aminodeoxychorismate lyase [Woeseiaceae bacterium]